MVSTRRGSPRLGGESSPLLGRDDDETDSPLRRSRRQQVGSGKDGGWENVQNDRDTESNANDAEKRQFARFDPDVKGGQCNNGNGSSLQRQVSLEEVSVSGGSMDSGSDSSNEDGDVEDDLDSVIDPYHREMFPWKYIVPKKGILRKPDEQSASSLKRRISFHTDVKESTEDAFYDGAKWTRRKHGIGLVTVDRVGLHGHRIAIGYGYRMDCGSYLDCYSSFFAIHNLSGNMWLCAIGALVVLYTWYSTGMQDGYLNLFYAAWGTTLGVALCADMFTSYSAKIAKTWRKRLFSSIILSTLSTQFLMSHYLTCGKKWRLINTFLCGVFLFGAFLISRWRHFCDYRLRTFRVTVFGIPTLISLIPVLAVFIGHDNAISAKAGEVFIYVVVATSILAFHFPERYIRGFDFFFHSTQIFTALVIIVFTKMSALSLSLKETPLCDANSDVDIF
eukprot:GFYU01011626.1.p1 GENE.GFYU01011626.1~~GFYU01011626.1.p1  ORF type:complete len:448 (+),score=94.22 GFYU01011626.1:319-1662(+)